MEEVLKNESQEVKNQVEVKRPWQGTTWAWVKIVLFSLNALFLVGFSILVFIGASLDEDYSSSQETIFFENQNLDSIFLFYLVVFIVAFSTLWAVLEIFAVVGFFKGWKSSVIVALSLNSLEIIIYLGTAIISMNLGVILGCFFAICLSGFMLYLAISCVNHPFYNQKKLA